MGMLDFRKKQNRVVFVPVDQVHPNPAQPRKNFDPAEIASLAESIRENGLIQPIAVRKTAADYELIVGERRLRAAVSIGEKQIAAIVYDLNDREAALWALTENLQRSDLDLFEEAEGIAELIDIWGVNQEEAARKLGLAPSTLSNKLRLLRLPEGVRAKIRSGGLTERHARALLRISDDVGKLQAADHMIKASLSVQEAEYYVDAILQRGQEKRPSAQTRYLIRDVRVFQNTIEHAVEVMKSAGIEALSTMTKEDGYLCYIIRVPEEKAMALPRSTVTAGSRTGA